MNDENKNTYLGLTFEKERFSLVGVKDNQIYALGTKELIQPFDLMTIREGNGVIESHSEILKDLYKKTHQLGKSVGAVLSNDMVLIKRIPMALGVNEEMVREQMMWESEQILISSLDHYKMAYQRLPVQTSAGNPMYLLVLIRKKVIQYIRSLMEKVGLQIKDLEVDIFANIRTITANYKLEPSDTAVLIDFHREAIFFTFIRQGEYYLSHCIPVESGVEGIHQQDSKEIVKMLTKELRRLIFGHRLGREIDDLSRIFLMGNGLTEDIVNTLSASMPIPLERVQPFQKIQVHKNVTQSKEFLKFPDRFITCVGEVVKRYPALVG